MNPKLIDQAKSLPNSDDVRAMREAERTIAQLRVQLQSERRKRQQAEDEALAADERAGMVEVLRSAAADPKPHDVPIKTRGNATAIVVMNDWHVEEKVEARSVNGLNEYNLDIASARIKKAFQNSLKILDSERTISRIEDAVLVLGGDMITGYIHEELAEENYLSPTEAVLFAQDQIADGIETLLKHAKLKDLHVVCAYGNHGRLTRKPRSSTAYKTSHEWLMYQVLSRFYAKNRRVRWTIAHSYHSYIDVQGKRIRIHHGDKLKYQGGVGGLTIPVLKAIDAWNKGSRADLDIFGHWHQALFAPNFICCNCLIGHNAYAIDIKAPHSHPSQTFLTIAKSHPRWVTAKEIFCQ